MQIRQSLYWDGALVFIMEILLPERTVYLLKQDPKDFVMALYQVCCIVIIAYGKQ